MAADRTPYIDQSQSVNLFIPADIHKRDLHQIHHMAWKKGMKSLYYCRSKSIQRAEDIFTEESGLESAVKGANVEMPLPSQDTEEIPIAARINDNTSENNDYDECLACQ